MDDFGIHQVFESTKKLLTKIDETISTELNEKMVEPHQVQLPAVASDN